VKVALFVKLRHNGATCSRNSAMVNEQQILNTITTANAGVPLAELLAQHLVLACRTAQRWISQWIA